MKEGITNEFVLLFSNHEKVLEHRVEENDILFDAIKLILPLGKIVPTLLDRAVNLLQDLSAESPQRRPKVSLWALFFFFFFFFGIVVKTQTLAAVARH